MIDDPHFIDAMVHELKSQGLFDQFRKECLADVDTKPAYQNLRQRVEGTVNKFLGQQEWSDNIRYKNQLREQLRKNIIESGFLDTGVERIVDQVVNPKIATIFQPKVEEIVYNYLGIEKPKSSVNGNEQTAARPESLLEDLEAVSPDSDKKSEGSLTPSPPPLPPQPPPPEEPEEHGVENMDIDEEDDALDESKEQDDFESPAFEPLEMRSPSKPTEDTNDSNSSVISGLTSQESVESDDKPEHNPMADAGSAKQSTSVPPSEEQETPTTKDSEFSQEVAPTNDSQLSQVSSNSQLLTATAASSSEEAQPPEENERLDITEEAQMPTLFSSSTDKLSSSNESEQEGKEAGKKITFDFKKDEYDFVGTERPSAMTLGEESNAEGNREPDPEEDSSTPTATPTETPTETPTKPKDSEEPNLTLQDEETSQSEHSLKICEDSFSDDNTKDSQSKDAPASVQDSPSKMKGLTDASSCSVKSDDGGKNVPATPADDKKDEQVPPEPEPEAANDEQKPEEKEMEETKEEKVQEDTERKDKSPKSDKDDDDHYQEHRKHEPNRRSSDRDSEDGNDKHDSGGSTAPSANGTGEKPNPSAQESSEKAPEKEKSPAKEPTDGIDPLMLSKERDRLCGSVTPTGEGAPMDSSSSGIQSGDDSEKSPETLKSYSKPESIVLPVQPVVIDQMLTSMEDDKIERLLNGETHTNDATLESLKRQWQSTEGRIRKPKFASNFSEARRLMKVRKQMQRQEQKCREQALAMAKKYISESKAFGGRCMEDQGIELEFVCDGTRKSPGPTISSPIPKAEPTGESVQVGGGSDAELRYFPEEQEVFQLDEKRLDFLRSKTEGVTFGKNFKVQHYRTIVYSLTVATPKVAKRAATPGVAGSGKAKRTATVNGVAKKLDLTVEDESKRAGLATIRKQRSIRNRLVEKSTPPSVGTDA
ncbi:AGAP002059-PB [Anopheles gambiae str. PEST]|uniref:AGAP002059-PA n=1 Tax=Anopheles gambiae TaxID=7165 RepID=Q7PL13_ANOGA|nr:AGAP002059-PA [Anopheles gambiae str. PEST]EAU75578.2 AGAP002059-PB [Anopheles gambiae str. PEST]